MTPRFEDSRLAPIRAKVEAGQRLTAEDGLLLYRTPDLLSVGWLANQVRERLHGNVTFFNINRHVNPTDVCVANCKLCAYGKRTRDGKAFTLTHEQVWHKAGEGYSEAVTEFHMVGGLHPELTLDWYCEMLRGLKQRFPKVHLKAFTMVESATLPNAPRCRSATSSSSSRKPASTRSPAAEPKFSPTVSAASSAITS
ncbi:MAG: hypothetical protein WDO18_01275 [Acidobacteriota bacterium]